MPRLYPRQFRDEYGDELGQLLDDIAADADPEPWVTRARRWAGTVADLAAAGARERISQRGRPTRTAVVRAGGAAAVFGGSVFLVSMLTPLRGWTRAGVPASVAAMAAGAVGLFAALHGRHPRLERLGFILAATGLSLGFLGMAGSALRVLPPSRLAAVINTGEHAGLVFIGAGMCSWGVLALRTSALGKLSFAPIPISLLGLAGITFLAPDTFAALEATVIPVVFAASWVLLGLALLTAPAPPAAPSPLA